MVNARIRRLVVRWHGKAKKDSDPFSRFVYLYFCVNALMTNLSEQHADRHALNWIYNNPNLLRSTYERLIQGSSMDGALRRLRQLPPVPTHRNPPAPHVLGIPDAASMREVLDFIYQVRCNLFHGRKDPQDEWDVAYVGACNGILMPLIRNVISDFDRVVEMPPNGVVNQDPTVPFTEGI